MPSKSVAYIHGEAEAQNVIYAIADEIVNASWTDVDGSAVENRWKKVYEQEPLVWVTYTQKTRNTNGTYKHIDGNIYPVYRVPDYRPTIAKAVNASFDNGRIQERISKDGPFTGRWIKVEGEVEYTNLDGDVVTVNIIGLLLSPTPNGTAVLSQQRVNLDGEIENDSGWNEFQLQGYLNAESAGNWNDFLNSNSWIIGRDSEYLPANPVSISRQVYSFAERYYEPTVHKYDGTVVLECEPDSPNGRDPEKFYLMFKKPVGQYNYFDVYYGKGFVGTNSVGSPEETYIGACDPKTVVPGQTPRIISMLHAEDLYKKQIRGQLEFKHPIEEWELDYDGVTPIKSPPAHFFYGADSTVPWLPNKKRRPDYWVGYWISMNNDHVCIVIEGDPTPDLQGFYRSFGYFGAIDPFNEDDYAGNFALTVGMGDLDANKTGFVVDDIRQNTNPVYSGFGRYTSNGMYSVSMLKTRSNVLFQAYYPAFMTQLPNYSDVGTLPSGLARLELEKHGYQASKWTSKYHASPIYLVHQFEGYRGHMHGVVAIDDHNLVNGDELVVDTEELKDPNDPTKGTFTEVYKFFSLKSPVNMFHRSPNPASTTIAILKEVY